MFFGLTLHFRILSALLALAAPPPGTDVRPPPASVMSTLNKLCVLSVVRVNRPAIDTLMRLVPTWIHGCIRGKLPIHHDVDEVVLAVSELVMRLSECDPELETRVLNSDLFVEAYLPILTAARLPSPVLLALANDNHDAELPSDVPPDLAMRWPVAVGFLAHLCDQIDLVLLRQLVALPIFPSVFDAMLLVSAHYPLDHTIHTAVGKIVAAVELLQLVPFQARYSIEACAARILASTPDASALPSVTVVDRQWITAKLIADPHASVHTWAVPQQTGVQCLAAFVTQLASMSSNFQQPDTPLQTMSWYNFIGTCFFGLHRNDGTVVTELALRVCLHAHDTLLHESHAPRWCSAALVAAAIKLLHMCRHVLPVSFFNPAPVDEEPPPPLTEDPSTLDVAVRTSILSWW